MKKSIGEAAYKKITKHRWYLQEETVVCVLFSDHPAVRDGDKREMAQKL